VNGLGELLAGKVPAGVYRWQVPGSTRRAEVDAAAAEAGWRLYWLAGQTVTDQQEFLQLCAETFEFPDYFGENWDALYDCLTDLTWADTPTGYLVVYAGWQGLAQEEPESFTTALDIFADAAGLWQDAGTPMAVLLPVSGPDALPDLPLLLSHNANACFPRPPSRRRGGGVLRRTQRRHALDAAAGAAGTETGPAAPAGGAQPGQPGVVRQQFGDAASAGNRDDRPDTAAGQGKPLPGPVEGGVARHGSHIPIFALTVN
jgi:Barstar (barnase inhibitor)